VSLISSVVPGVAAGHVTVSTTAGEAGRASAVVEIAVRGLWSDTVGVDVSAALRSCLVDRPGGVIIDLHGMSDDRAASLPLWLAARRAAAGTRPPVPLALCLPATAVLRDRLRRIGARRLPMYATMMEARSALTPFAPCLRA
jgi:hypothetical protein